MIVKMGKHSSKLENSVEGMEEEGRRIYNFFQSIKNMPPTPEREKKLGEIRDKVRDFMKKYGLENLNIEDYNPFKRQKGY